MPIPTGRSWLVPGLGNSVTFEAEGAVRMTWEIEPGDDGGSKLTVTSALKPESKAAEEFAGGIVFIVSGLKTFVETGEPLSVG